jgi:hypothetical protein
VCDENELGRQRRIGGEVALIRRFALLLEGDTDGGGGEQRERCDDGDDSGTPPGGAALRSGAGYQSIFDVQSYRLGGIADRLA